jgi:hypothetical protein
LHITYEEFRWRFNFEADFAHAKVALNYIHLSISHDSVWVIFTQVQIQQARPATESDAMFTYLKTKTFKNQAEVFRKSMPFHRNLLLRAMTLNFLVEINCFALHRAMNDTFSTSRLKKNNITSALFVKFATVLHRGGPFPTLHSP